MRDDERSLADRFRGFADGVEAGVALYAELARGAADDEEVLGLLAAAPREQRLPVLLLAAVHELVLAEPDLELAQWYPSVVEQPRDGPAYPAFARLCRERADQLRTTLAERRTQTNEVGRGTLFLPTLGVLADEVGPLSLVDVGASAGLNLLLDHWRYHYEHELGPAGTVGPGAGSAGVVELVCETTGPVPVPGSMPVLAHRVGLDARPIDVDHEAATRWLDACVWPGQRERRERLRAALAVARDVGVRVEQGDAVDDLAPLVGEAAAHGHPVVTNCWVLNDLPADRRAAYVAELDRLGDDLDMTWVSAEAPYAASPGLPFDPDPDRELLTHVNVARWRDGERTIEHVATAQPHGAWLHWRAEPLVLTRRH